MQIPIKKCSDRGLTLGAQRHLDTVHTTISSEHGRQPGNLPDRARCATDALAAVTVAAPS